MFEILSKFCLFSLSLSNVMFFLCKNLCDPTSRSEVGNAFRLAGHIGNKLGLRGPVEVP